VANPDPHPYGPLAEYVHSAALTTYRRKLSMLTLFIQNGISRIIGTSPPGRDDPRLALRTE
jgi:hypothetical protein